MNKQLTVDEVIKECQISRSTLYRLLNEGLPYVQVGVRSKLFDVDVVKEFIANRERGIKLKPGEIISKTELPSIFYCSSTGEVRRSNRQNALLIISNKNSQKLFGDYWDGNTFNFVLTNQGSDFQYCKDLDYAIERSATIYLFETFKDDELIYRGNIKPLNKEITTQVIINISENSDEKLYIDKKIYVFELINNNVLISEEVIELQDDKLFESIIKDEENILKTKAQLNEGINSKRLVSKIKYERNVYVAQYILKKADGICMLCNQKGPFLVKGMPYLEVHHIIPVSKGGLDTIDNCVALCPNCHKRMHILNDKEDIKYLYDLKSIPD